MHHALQQRLAAALPADAASVPFGAAVTSLPADQHGPPAAIGVDDPVALEQEDAHGTTTTTGSWASSSPSPTIISITMTTPTSALTPSPFSSPNMPAIASSPDNNNGECRLLGPFALLVQLALGGLALLSLVYKRWRERPQRPVKIWFFDVSKQVFGSVLVHIANVFMSMLTSGRFDIKVTPETITPARAVTGLVMARVLGRRGEEYTPNPCSFYLLNIAVDTTLGIPILIILLRLYTSLVALTPLGKPRESIQSGNYGRPPNAWWWLKQSFIYFCGLFGMKICVLIIFLAFPWISRVGDWALGWTEGNEKLQVVFVMMLFPLIMNAMQYYIIDSFIKLKESGEERSGDGEDDSESDTSSEGAGSVYDGVPGDSDEEEEPQGEVAVGKKAGAKARVDGKRTDAEEREYDPDVDGETQTVIGSNSSRTPAGRGKLLPKEMLPHE